MDNYQAQKQQLRRQYLALRKNMDEELHKTRSAAIRAALKELPELVKARTIHCYWPSYPQREIDLRPLISQFRQEGKQIVLPKVISYREWSPGVNRMEHRVFTGETNLIANRWDVYEPGETPIVPVSQLDVIVVPAIVASRSGYRIGYGKGYYDEFLAQAECPTICPVFSAFLVDTIPSETHDTPVDIVLTEHEVFYPTQGATC